MSMRATLQHRVLPSLGSWLLPDPGLPLEDQFFHGLCVLGGLLAFFVVIPLDAFQHLDPWVNGLTAIFGLLALGLAWAARGGWYGRKTLVLSFLLFLDLVWFPNGGSEGSAGLFFIVPTLLIVLFFQGAYRLLGVLLVMADLIGLQLAELAWPRLAVPFKSPSDRFLDFSSSMAVSLLLSSLMLWVILEGFTRERERGRTTLLALRKSEARHRLLADNATDVIWTMDPAGCLTYVSPSVERLRGFTIAEALGQSLEEIFTPASAPAVRAALAAALEAGPRGLELPMYQNVVEETRKDGTTIQVELTASAMRDAQGDFIGILGVSRDVTERVRLQADHERMEGHLRQLEKMESLGTLAGGVAHDMNNVLGAILGLASVHQHLADPASPLARDMATVTKACLRGGALVKGLLGFARKGLAEERELDLNAVVREEVALLERTTLQRIRLVTALAGDLQPMRGDPSALSHALMNLCVNAVDAMPEGGTLTLRTRNGEEGMVLLDVEDTGCGMPRQVQDQALDPFFTTKPRGQGTGLGLAIVFTTVKAHRGSLDLWSEPGQGTRITLAFPAHRRDPFDPETDPRPAFEPATASLQVLLVDDDELILEAVGALLEVLGHSPTLAPGGEAALAELEAGLEPDVIILDLNMPGLDGHRALPRLRSLRPHVPVLLATGLPDTRTQALMDAYPGVTLLAKPFSITDLQTKLAASL